MNTTKKAGKHRLFPCPAYDVAGTERWLSELAEEGWYLRRDGIFADIASFEFREPGAVRYRLEAAQKKPGLWSESDGEPDPEELELNGKYSWEYVARRKDFYIYRSADPSARELHTDPAVQALALDAVKKRQRGALISSLLLFFIYPFILTRGCVLMTTLALGSWWMLLVAVFAALILFDDVRAFVHLKKTRDAILSGGYDTTERDWRREAAPYLIRKAVKGLLAVFLLCTLLQNWGLSITGENRIPIEDYTGTFPFATLRDFAGTDNSGYAQTMTGMNMGFNTVELRSDWLAPCCIAYNEHAAVKTADGQRIDGSLYVDYFELRTPWLAKLAAYELQFRDRLEKHYTPMAVPALPADEAAAYVNNLHFPTVVLRKGSVVARVTFYQYQSAAASALPFEAWAQIACDDLTDGG